jgi:hypothetical protein
MFAAPTMTSELEPVIDTLHDYGGALPLAGRSRARLQAARNGLRHDAVTPPVVPRRAGRLVGNLITNVGI